MEVISAHVSAIAHATEDPERVMQALDNVCPQDRFQTKTEKRRVKGHYGNEIVTFTLNIHGRSAELFLNNLWEMLPQSDRAMILHDIDGRLDGDGRLHLRLDKQGCVRNVFRLWDKDPIKIQVAFQAKLGPSGALAEQIRRSLGIATRLSLNLMMMRSERDDIM